MPVAWGNQFFKNKRIQWLRAINKNDYSNGQQKKKSANSLLVFNQVKSTKFRKMLHNSYLDKHVYSINNQTLLVLILTIHIKISIVTWLKEYTFISRYANAFLRKQKQNYMNNMFWAKLIDMKWNSFPHCNHSLIQKYKIWKKFTT